MRVGVIINPVAGRSGYRRDTGLRREALARTLCATRNVDAQIVMTHGCGDASALARRFRDQQFDRVIAWGGDGTVVEAATPLVGTSTILGIVRAGSGDGFARGLGIPTRPAEALDLALSASIRTVDVGRFGDRFFLNVAGIGFDAAVACAFNQRRRRGLSGYLLEVFRLLRTYTPSSYRMEFDGDQEYGRRYLIVFSNGPEYGNGVVVAPDADLSDGQLDVVSLDEGAVPVQLWRARRLVVGRRRAARGVLRRRIATARISAPDLVCHVDGETCLLTGDVTVSVMPAALRVAAPRSA
jgi:YegS/Rv2252/BmrU family lipid kinase